EWEDELYLELHRGCYTTHADQKWYNRRCEDLLYGAEVWCTIAQLVAQQPYPQVQLEQAWKAMLFNQFHDILPGSAIPEVFDDANLGWQQAQAIATAHLEQALQQLISCIDLPAPPQPDAQPIVVFNALSWDRREVVSITLPGPTLPGPTLPGLQTSGWKIFDGDGQLISHQLQVFDATDKYLSKINDEKGDTLLDPPGFATPLIKGGLGGIPRTRDTENSSAQLLVLFLAAVPAVGYSVYWRCPSVSELPADRVEGETPTDYRLENDRLRVSICATTGEILSLFDRVYGREVLDGRANQLQAFSDDGQYWDAWNLAPDYESRSYGAAQLEDMQWLERGPLRQCLRVRRRLGRSQITQVYCLEADSPLLKIETEVDWQETQVLLKVNFPTAFQAEVATYEAPFGATVRTTAAPPPGPEQSKEQKLMDQTAEDREGAIAPTPPNSDDYQQAHAKTKWEVPALRWADLTDPDQDYGLSVLTDGKHGFDAKPNQLRLTLLKAPLWPDPSADRGQHRFTYALYPHSGSWQQA
ncbi:MAG: glycoside hydrolase family 38 C-terminal domain-containing protein, partial [Cyanobacteria bacterium P01_A01_bin.105]